jgi:hypothetical protein
VEWWLVVGGRGVGVVDATIFDLIFDDECRRQASAFKEQREPSGVSFEFIVWRPSRRRLLSSGG